MLRQILSASLVMTACVSFIPTSANAATLTVLPSGEIPKKVNDSIEFTFTFNPEPASLKYLGADLFNLLFDYDKDELRLRGPVTPIISSLPYITYPYAIGSYAFDVLKPIKDGQPDLFNARISYTEYYSTATHSNRQTPITFGGDVVPISEPSTAVPEPLTIFGTATALGGGILLKRKSFKMKKS
jgi:hypothetical protein